MKKKLTFKKALKNFIGNIGDQFKKIDKKIIGILFIAILLIILVSKLFGTKDIDYPVVFNDSDGDLYLMTTKVYSKDDGVKLATSESSTRVKYANNTDRYVIFQKEENLYLYDSHKKSETTKIIDNIAGTNYYFTGNDKYIVALDEDDNIQIYNFKTTKKVEGGVSTILEISEDHILFEKDGILYIRSANPNKDDKNKISDSYNANVLFSEDGKSVIYTDTDNKLHVYNVKNKEDNIIDSDVTNYYCDLETCNKMYYVKTGDTRDIYYYNGKKGVLVEEDVYSVLERDASKEQIIYTKANGNSYDLYYQKGTKEADKVDSDVGIVKSAKLYNNKVIYYINGDNKVKYAKISGSKISRRLDLLENVSGYLTEYKDGYAVITDVDDNYNGTLYILKGSKAKKIDTSVNSSKVVVSNDGKKIYYLKDYEISGTLYVATGTKTKEIAKDVHLFEYMNNDLIYYIRDYNSSKSRGDLYRYTGKSKKIVENVSRLASSPVYYDN